MILKTERGISASEIVTGRDDRKWQHYRKHRPQTDCILVSLEKRTVESLPLLMPLRDRKYRLSQT